MARREDRWNDRALLRMIERDTISLAMSPGARENRYKPTGNAKLLVVVNTQYCNYVGCGEPASLVKKTNGKTERRCREHIGAVA